MNFITFCNSNNKLISYTITKREPVVNGVTKIFRKAINQRDQKPFMKIFSSSNFSPLII